MSEALKRLIAERALVRSDSGIRITHADTNIREISWLFDIRAIFFKPEFLKEYTESFWKMFAHQLPFQVGGLETAGIPLVSAIVMSSIERGTPVNGFFIRKSRKREGLMKAIEGALTTEPVILVDDLVNSGHTFRKQIAVLKDAGATVSDTFALVSFRPSSAYREIERGGTRVRSVFSLNDFGIPLLPEEPAAAQSDEWRVLWKASGGKPSLEYVVPKSGPVVDEQHVYIGTDDGRMLCYSKESGVEVWSFRIGDHPPGKGIFSTPALHGGRIFFGAYDGNVYCLDAHDGTEVWRNTDADWIGSSPALAPKLDLLFVGLEFGLWGKRGGIAAIRMSTGKSVWRARTPELTHGSPLYIPEENVVVIGSNDGILYAYDARSGSELWNVRTRGEIKYRPAYDKERRLVLVNSFDGNLHALHVDDGTHAFAYSMGAPSYSAPVTSGRLVYTASLDKHVYAIDLDTGKKLWSFATRGRIFASPIIEEGSLWIGSNDGCLYELDPETGARRGFFQATERIVNAIAYDARGQRFFVPTVANELYCLERNKNA